MLAERVCLCGIVFTPDAPRQRSCRICRARYEETVGRRWRPGAYGAGETMTRVESVEEDGLWMEILSVYHRATTTIAAERATMAAQAQADRRDWLRRALRL